MRNLKDNLVVAITAALEVYGVLLAGRYFGWNGMALNAWAAVSVLGLFIISFYYTWWRH